MKSTIYGCIIFLLLEGAVAFGTTTPQLEWIRTYDSPAHDDDGAGNVAFDA